MINYDDDNDCKDNKTPLKYNEWEFFNILSKISPNSRYSEKIVSIP